MTAIRSVHLVCDGCSTELSIAMARYSDAREVAASEHEWSSHKGRTEIDYCKRCSNITVTRRGDEVIASHGKVVVEIQRFPLDIPASEWESLLYTVESAAEHAKGRGETGEALTRIAEFVRVEVMLVAD